jgi:hypothetical protein
MEGNKELKEALVGFIALASEIAKVSKDGVQIADATVLFAKLQEPAIAEKLKAAYEGIEKVPSEAKDLEIMEVFELVSAIMPELLGLVSALKK